MDSSSNDNSNSNAVGVYSEEELYQQLKRFEVIDPEKSELVETLPDLEEKSNYYKHQKEYWRSPKGRIAKANANASPAQKYQEEIYRKSEHGRIRNLRYKRSDLGQAAVQRELTKRKETRSTLRIFEDNVKLGKCLCGANQICDSHKDFVQTIQRYISIG